MKTRVGCLARSPRKCRPGFTLVELLLAVALILALLSAVVFNFSSFQQSAELEEGATQFESLLCYARAHAANTGRKVRLTFEEDAGDGLLVPLGNFAVSWEPDPLGQPDQFRPLAETADYVNSILDVISIEDVRAAGTASVPPASTDGTGPVPAPAGGAAPAPGEPSGFGFSPIYFYPDGSCDSSEIIITARNGEDGRRVALRLVGLTGAIQRRIIEAEMPGAGEEPAVSTESTKLTADK